MTASELTIGRLDPVHPDRSALRLCVAPLTRPDDCRGRSRQWSLLRCGFHVLVVCTGGTGEQRIDVETYPVRAGTVLWLRPGLVHSPAPEVEGTAVCFTTELADDVSRLVPGVLWQLAGEDARDVAGHVALLAEEYRRYAFDPTGPELAHGDAMLEHLLAAMLLRLGQVEPVVGDRRGCTNQLAARFLALVDERYAELHSAEQYAAALHCSVRTLARACVDAGGSTPKEIIDSRRSVEARRLLSFTDLSVQAIGRRLGFDDAANFGRFFARTVGVTPGAYRAHS
ncbi:MAG: AraC family transcriptional regulator [Actinobacteria bacterium]|nr:AraC family transcriptional regulator [Actinomycetota bacterium]